MSKNELKRLHPRIVAASKAAGFYTNYRWDFNRLKVRKDVKRAELELARIEMERSKRELMASVDADLLAAIFDRLTVLEEEVRRQKKEKEKEEGEIKDEAAAMDAEVEAEFRRTRGIGDTP